MARTRNLSNTGDYRRGSATALVGPIAALLDASDAAYGALAAQVAGADRTLVAPVTLPQAACSAAFADIIGIVCWCRANSAHVSESSSAFIGAPVRLFLVRRKIPNGESGLYFFLVGLWRSCCCSGWPSYHDGLWVPKRRRHHWFRADYCRAAGRRRVTSRRQCRNQNMATARVLMALLICGAARRPAARFFSR